MALTANELARTTDSTPVEGDSIEQLLVRLILATEALGTATRYLGYVNYTFEGNDEGSLADLMETQLDNWPRTREVAVVNVGTGSQVVAGETLAEGDVLPLTLSQVIAATYEITGTGGANLQVFFIA